MPIAGGTPIRISEDLTGVGYNADVVDGADRLAFTPDGLSVIYLADSRANGVNEMNIVPVVPEPASALLFAVALVSSLSMTRRR